MWKASVTAAGCSGLPSSSVNSNPESAQASPAASFSLSCSCRQRVMSVTVSASRATVRSPASDLGAPWTGSQPSWVICQRIVDSAASRSVSGRRSPQPSPRRRPRVAISRHSACSRCRRAASRKTMVWAGVQTMTGDGRGHGDPDVDRADPPAGRAGGGQPGVEVLLPGADPLAGPDQGLGPGAGGQLDEGGDVGGQRAGVLLHVGADAPSGGWRGSAGRWPGRPGGVP